MKTWKGKWEGGKKRRNWVFTGWFDNGATFLPSCHFSRSILDNANPNHVIPGLFISYKQFTYWEVFVERSSHRGSYLIFITLEQFSKFNFGEIVNKRNLENLSLAYSSPHRKLLTANFQTSIPRRRAMPLPEREKSPFWLSLSLIRKAPVRFSEYCSCLSASALLIAPKNHLKRRET